MELDAVPEPDEEEREAIARALAAVERERDADPGEWWRAGVRENVSVDEPQAAAVPRRSPGATRA